MAKYNITYACGCNGTINVCGPTKDRDRKVAWVAEQDCPKCARKAAGVRGVLTVSARDDSGAPTAVRITLVGDTYPVKEAIKAAGYKFAKDALWMDPLGARVEAGWFQSFDVTDGTDVLAAEVTRVSSLGWKVEKDNALNQLMAHLHC